MIPPRDPFLPHSYLSNLISWKAFEASYSKKSQTPLSLAPRDTLTAKVAAVVQPQGHAWLALPISSLMQDFSSLRHGTPHLSQISPHCIILSL